MIVTIEKFFDQSKTGKSGKAYNVTTFEGVKKGYKGAPDEPWKKDFMPWKHGDFIDKLKAIGIGNQAMIKSEKQNGYWEITDVSPYGNGSGGGNGGSPPPQPQQKPQAQGQVPNVPIVYSPPAAPGDSKYIGVLKVASDLVMKMMDQSENFKNLIKKTATPELVKQMVVDLANAFYANDPTGSDPGADASGVLPQGDDGGGGSSGGSDGATPPDDDIPF